MKKTMKRSLALGALMAFVITGSAMAASGINASGKDVNGNELFPDGVIKGFDNGIYAKGDSSTQKIATASMNLDNIVIQADKKGVYALDYSVVKLGSDSSDGSVRIESENVKGTAATGIELSGTGSLVEVIGRDNIINSVTKAGNSYGIYNHSSSKINVLGTNIVVSSISSKGTTKAIYVYKGKSETNIGGVDSNGVITTESIVIKAEAGKEKSGNNIYAIDSNGDAKVNINGKNINIEVQSGVCNGENYGISNRGNSVIQINGNDTDISSIGDNRVIAIGNISSNSKLDINSTNTLDIIAKSKNKTAIGIEANYGTTTIESNKINVNAFTAGADTTLINQAIGITTLKGNLLIKGSYLDVVATNEGKGNAVGFYVKANEKNKDGIVNVDSSNVNITAKSNDESGDTYAMGVLAAGQANTVIGKENSESVIIKAINNKGLAWGVDAQSNGDNTGAGSVDINGKNIEINAEGNTARGINAASGASIDLGNEGSKVSVHSNAKGESSAINSFEGSTVNVFAKELYIEAKSDIGDSSGIHVQNNTVVEGAPYATVNVNAEKTVIKANTALSAMSQGQIVVDSDIYTEGKNAVVARGNAVVRVNEDGSHATQLNGDINFNFDGVTSKTDVDADVLVNLNGKDSYWNGNSKVTWHTKEGNASDVTAEKLAVDSFTLNIGNGAQWNPNKVVNEGTIGEVEDGTQYVALNNLKLDSGVINLEKMGDQTLQVENLYGTSGIINVADLDNNKMSIDDKDANTQLTVNGNGAIADQIAADKDKANDLANVVVSGDKTAANKVTTDEGTIGGRFEGTVDKDGKVTGFQAKNTSNVGISDMASIGLMAWRQENNDMNKRLGELRNSKGEHGVWTRMTRGESEFKSIKNQYNAYQIGYDEKLSTDKSWTVGAALTYTDAESSFAKGTGENTHKGFAIYGSKLNEDGSFIDLIAKYARLEHEFDAVGGIGKGEYDTNGYSVSAEYGKRFEKGNGFWVEPQVELTYGKVGSVNYATKEAVAYQDGMESLVGRVGFSLGKDIKDGNVYVRASYLYDFDGETQVTMTNGTASDTYEQDLGGGWFEVGVGTNINLSDATYVYLDVEKTYGGDVATPWQWNAGVRYSF